MTSHKRLRSLARPAALSTPSERGWRSWKRRAQVAWVVLALVLLVDFVVNIPVYYHFAHAGCPYPSPADCPTGILTKGNMQALARLHLPVTAAGDFLATLTLAVSVLYWVVGILIFWRESHEWMGLITALTCVLLGATGLYGFIAGGRLPQPVHALTYITELALVPVLGAFLCTFPTGRFTPRWTWVVFVIFIISNTVLPSVASNLPNLLIVGGQIYRYLRISDAVERQQTRWFVFGFGVSFSALGIYYVLGAVVPGLSAPDSWYQLLSALTWLLVWTLLLLSVSIAILRYRLWDLDGIINRTLVYGSLTTLLIALYFGLILTLQALVRGIVSSSLSQHPLVIVCSTLVIAALFDPLRRGLQAFIDRRFYRRKYDAAKVVAAFSTTLRQEADPDLLHTQLLSVVQETMQPSHVSLWVPQPKRTKAPSSNSPFRSEGQRN